MAKIKRNQFTFYDSFYLASKAISDPTERGQFLMAVIEYALEGKEPEMLPECCAAAFCVIRPVLDSSRRKAENGSKGGSTGKSGEEANRKQKQANSKQTEANRKQEKEQEKEQVKEQVKEQLQQTASSAESTGPMREVLELWEAYPPHRRDTIEVVMDTAAGQQLTKNDFLLAASNLALWKKSNEWTKENGRFVPGLCKWLESGKWRSGPPAAQLTSNPFLAMMMEAEFHDQE